MFRERLIICIIQEVNSQHNYTNERVRDSKKHQKYCSQLHWCAGKTNCSTVWFRNISNSNRSTFQVKVREATSNDPWGPPSSLMSEISDLTYNVVAFSEIMQMIWKRLNDHGKNYRHVYKALVLLDYLVKTGNEKVAQQCKENIFAIHTLRVWLLMLSLYRWI